ncbi:unnamed protein product [Psylliodes chrysocephalus]|uniref:apyrase n=1 Tax=Psylliodes chrysocephalus TaxID=3402493 RepID=A0A9P0D293_9CUCU|nr:unnamed protein product [Psylliodes chrysocephala]
MSQFKYALAIFFLVSVGICAGCPPRKRQTKPFELSVVHYNDFHARFQQTNSNGGTCKNETECIGGFSRLYKQITTLFEKKPKSILLNAGDNFQGTLYYSIGKWNITQEFMNKLPIDATVLGNHEFDDGIKGVVPFIKALKSPVVTSNIDDSLEPSIQGLYKKSTVIERDGKKIGIIGVITSECAQIANTGKLSFFQESVSVNAEAERLVREEGVYTIIVLSHSGYDVDKIIAQNASERISLIVGGHSHTFLYTGDNPPGPDPVEGPYPTIVQSKNGHRVLVAQAAEHSKYVGNLNVFLGEKGEVVGFAGAPIFLDTSFPQDESINAALQPWKEIIDREGARVLGSTLVKLDRTNCFTQECTLGNFVTDAFVYQYTKTAPEGSWTEAAIALMNAGGLRTNIEVGNITFMDMVTAQPFGNTVDFGQIKGKYLKELMEAATKEYYYRRLYSSLNMLQVSGLQIVYDFSKPNGQKVVSMKARCADCLVPVYEDLVPEKLYSVAIPGFLTNGGDGFTVLSDNLINKRVGFVDMDIFIDYLANNSPISEEIEGRITILN